MVTTSVFSLLSALTVAALPHVVVDKAPISHSLSRRLNAGVSVRHIAEMDRARARALKSRGSASRPPMERAAVGSPDPVPNNPLVAYVVAGIGTPPTNYTLLVDTASPLTWIGANKRYVPSNSSKEAGQEVVIGDLISGIHGTGEGFFDTITLGDLTVKAQFIGVSLTEFDFNGGLDGVLGIGPIDLSSDSGFSSSGHPTVTNNAFIQDLIPSDEVGMYFLPTTSSPIADGQQTFGGVDPSFLTSLFTTVPITSTAPSKEFIGIDQAISYGTPDATILRSTAGVVDSGTTLILIASDAFALYQKATGATLDENTGLLRLPASQYNTLESLFFDISGTTFEFTSNAQIFPRVFNERIGGDNESIYLIVTDLGSPSGEGLDFINGLTFLQRFYTVYNSQTPSFGIATTPFTTAETN